MWGPASALFGLHRELVSRPHRTKGHIVSSTLLLETTESTVRPHRRPQHHVRHRRVALVAVAVAVVLTLAACVPPYPVRDGYEANAARAATWMEGSFSQNPTGAGGLADLIFGLAAVEGDRAIAESAYAQLAVATPSYVQPTPTFVNWAGAAKVMIAVKIMGGNVNNFAGLDLEALVRGSLTVGGPDDGRFGTFTNVFGQALAIMALNRTPGSVPASAASWLVSRQCPDGGFSWGACSQADGDYTGIATQALAASLQIGARDAGIEWLLVNQRTDGGWHASNSPTISNTNSTGIAVQALQTGSTIREEAELEAAMAAAAAYVAGLQYADGPDAGAIPWHSGAPGSIFLATTQGVFAWGGAGPHHQITWPEPE